MGILNLTPDSFFEPSRYNMSVLDSGADIIDVGAVSSRPGATDVPLEEEWSRLEPFLKEWRGGTPLSLDTTRSEIVRRACDLVGRVMVNDISAGEEDPGMLPLVGRTGLPYIAMFRHPMASVEDAIRYFEKFSMKAERYGITDWIVDPGFGFNKDVEDNLALMDALDRFKAFGRPLLAGIADKRFTRGNTEEYHLQALSKGADILRVHDVKKARHTVRLFEESLIK